MTKQPCWISDWKWPSSRFEFLNENNQAAMLNFWKKITNQPSWISEWKWPSSHAEFLNENDQAAMFLAHFWTENIHCCEVKDRELPIS